MIAKKKHLIIYNICDTDFASLIILRYSGTVIAKDDSGATPKHIAQIYGHKECATFLQT